MTKTKKIKLIVISIVALLPLLAFAGYKSMSTADSNIGDRGNPSAVPGENTDLDQLAIKNPQIQSDNHKDENSDDESDTKTTASPETQNNNESITPAGTSVPAKTPVTSSPSSPPPSEPEDTGPKPTGASGSWALDFEDNFSTTTLDLSKWRPNWIGGSDTAITPPINTREESCYDPAQVSVSDGSLKLAAQAVTPGARPGCNVRGGADASYASGIVTSYHDYRFTHGFVESRIWLPPSTGAPQNFPAFWANGLGPWPQTGEIDIMEALNGVYKWHFHYADGLGDHQSYSGGTSIIANTGGWHTFGANWQADKITFYYDGLNAGSVTNNVTSNEMYIILNNGLSSSISPPVVAPSEMKVDYVRVWK